MWHRRVTRGRLQGTAVLRRHAGTSCHTCPESGLSSWTRLEHVSSCGWEKMKSSLKRWTQTCAIKQRVLAQREHSCSWRVKRWTKIWRILQWELINEPLEPMHVCYLLIVNITIDFQYMVEEHEFIHSGWSWWFRGDWWRWRGGGSAHQWH